MFCGTVWSCRDTELYLIYFILFFFTGQKRHHTRQMVVISQGVISLLINHEGILGVTSNKSIIMSSPFLKSQVCFHPVYCYCDASVFHREAVAQISFFVAACRLWRLNWNEMVCPKEDLQCTPPAVPAITAALQSMALETLGFNGAWFWQLNHFCWTELKHSVYCACCLLHSESREKCPHVASFVSHEKKVAAVWYSRFYLPSVDYILWHIGHDTHTQ